MVPKKVVSKNGITMNGTTKSGIKNVVSQGMVPQRVVAQGVTLKSLEYHYNLLSIKYFFENLFPCHYVVYKFYFSDVLFLFLI